jgi:magnesium transporter
MGRAEPMAVTITLTAFVDGQAQAPSAVAAGFTRTPRAAGAVLWLDVAQPTAAELLLLEEELALPPLAVEDVREAHQRPKVNHYEDWVLIVCYAAQYGPGDDAMSFHEVDLFVGRDYVLTVRQEPALDEKVLRDDLTMTQGRPLRSNSALAHAVLDRVVDAYFGVTDEIESRVEAIDERVWDGLGQEDLAQAFALRRDLVRFRRVVAPLRELLTILVRRERGVFDDSMDEHLRDLYDHVVTVHEEIEMSRDLLASTLDGHLSRVSNRMNETVLKVSAWAAIIAVPTVIASIYGMNFVDMPELKWSAGYPGALALMTAAAAALYALFKRRGWL